MVGCLVQSFCGSFEDGGGTVEGFGQGCELTLGAGSIHGFDGLVDSWNDNGRVAGELAWSIDGVAVPRAFWQTVGVEEGLFCFAQCMVESRGVRGWAGLCCADGGAGCGETFGCREYGSEVEG